MSGSTPDVMLQQVAYEQVVEKLLAPRYNISVNSSEIESQLKADATASSNVTSDADFKKWYASQLKSTGLSDAQFREMTGVRIFAAHMLDFLGTTIPPTAQQDHVYVIVTANSDDAVKTKLRVGAGDNFSAVASEISLDTQTKLNGGEIGWVPYGVTGYDDTFFDLAPGQVNAPVALDPTQPDSQWAIFMVTEVDPNRQIDAASLQTMKSRDLYTLIQQQLPQYVKFSLTTADQDWINKRLAKQP